MNTVEKGDAFEDRVHKVFESLLNLGELGFDSKRSQVHKKKKYYSKNQDAYITFDISIEIYMPKSSSPSFLILIECKDYKTPIDVHKIRNFEGQIQEVGGHKGYFITSSKFQQGAISLAATHRIGLMILNINNDLSWIVRRSSTENLTLTDNKGIPFIATIDNRIFTNIIDFLSYENLDIKQNNSNFKVQFLTESIIEENVASSLQKCSYSSRLKLAYLPKKGIETSYNRGENLNSLLNFKIHSHEIIGILKEKYNINVVENHPLNENELGRLNISNRTIYLSERLSKESPRWRFTLAHEFAHVALHEKLLINSNIYILSDNDNMDDPYLRYTNIALSASVRRMEIQANIFACILLMPTIPMAIELTRIKKELGIRQHRIRLDDQPINIKNYNIIVSKISDQFGVSKQVVRHKMYDLKLIEDFSHIQTIRQSIDTLKLALLEDN